ncbi:SCO4225 family membrane protein [Streptomyces sp. NPDC018693]|uniref:SCO4225 family membrane protein n=1 Tax=unclassified Streptomyces TaxID=2593676 RepID=UPI0037985FD0
MPRSPRPGIVVIGSSTDDHRRPSENTMGFPHRIRTVLGLGVNNWVSRGYLAVVALTVLLAVYDEHFVTHPDASMAYVVPLMLTAPFSLPLLMALDGIPTDIPFYVALAGGAYVNALALGALVRLAGGRRPGSRPAPTA